MPATYSRATADRQFQKIRFTSPPPLRAVDYAADRTLVFDPRDDGATGLGSVDDTSAIQACIARMQTALGIGGGILDLRNGEWLISDTLLFTRWSGVVLGSGWTNAKTYGSGGVAGTDNAAGTTIRWAVGAGAKPMFQFRDSQGVLVQDIKFQGASESANPSDIPTAAINFKYLTGDNKGSNSKLFVDRCYIGPYAWTNSNPDDHCVAVGVLFDGDNGNNDEWVISRSLIEGCTTAGVHLPNSQSTWGRISDTTISQCAIGIQTSADMRAENVVMNRNDLDWKLGTDLTVWANGYSTENATKLIEAGVRAKFIMNGGDLGPFTGSTLADPMIEVADCRSNWLVFRDVDFDGVGTQKIAMKSNTGTSNQSGHLVIEDCRGLTLATQLDINPAGTGHARFVSIRDTASDTSINQKLTTALANSVALGTGWTS